MLYTILHISDLHMKGEDPSSNRELLSGLVADFERSGRETPCVTRPDAIIVSGDLAEGLPLQSETYPDGLRAQYHQAEEFLACLTDEFLRGDRSRVILVPGNHDVDWNVAFSALEAEDGETADPRSLVGSPETKYRWSWTHRNIFRIADVEQYKSRFWHFNQMYSGFYRDVGLQHDVDPTRPWNLFSLDGGQIIVGAFNSCMINDCFGDLGHISHTDLAECHLAMRRVSRPGCLPVAVWHHGVGGPPLASDYLDAESVKLMIDKGFRLGMHGHRHDSTISPANLFVSTRERMAVIGAGSLCSGPSRLPHGVNRRYNVIQIEREQRRGLVHVREMNQANIWGPGQLFENGGRSHVCIDWTASALEVGDQARSGGSVITEIDNIERLISAGLFSEAREALAADLALTPTYKRQLLAKLLTKAEDWTDLKDLLKCPQNEEELAMYVFASERTADMTGVEAVLKAAGANSEFSAQLVAELRRRVEARSKLESGR